MFNKLKIDKQKFGEDILCEDLFYSINSNQITLQSLEISIKFGKMFEIIIIEQIFLGYEMGQRDTHFCKIACISYMLLIIVRCLLGMVLCSNSF